MKNLNKIFDDLLSNKNRWCYYTDINIDTANVYIDNNLSYEFIKKYFEWGGKGSLNDELGDKFLKIDKRALHTVSVYLIGISIAKDLKYLPSTFIEKRNFLYRWFLTCLYHDYGYVYENKRKIIDNLNEFIEVNIKHKLPDYDPYNKEVIELYFNKRDVYDHGIVGGLLLYDRLRKNYENAWKEREIEESKGESPENFTYRGLSFSKEHFQDYEKAAQTIMAHNIFKKTLKDNITEHNVGLSESEKIRFDADSIYFNFTDNFLLSLLGIADTIEPIKRFVGIKPECILNMISFEIKAADKTIKIQVNGNCFDTKKYFASIVDLNKWIDVDVVEKDNAISITIH